MTRLTDPVLKFYQVTLWEILFGMAYKEPMKFRTFIQISSGAPLIKVQNADIFRCFNFTNSFTCLLSSKPMAGIKLCGLCCTDTQWKGLLTVRHYHNNEHVSVYLIRFHLEIHILTNIITIYMQIKIDSYQFENVTII